VLVDFGWPSRTDPSVSTSTGARGVTPGYAPPEQYGRSSTDARSDLYAVGATLYALLTGHTPPDGVDLAAPPGRSDPTAPAEPGGDSPQPRRDPEGDAPSRRIAIRRRRAARRPQGGGRRRTDPAMPAHPRICRIWPRRPGPGRQVKPGTPVAGCGRRAQGARPALRRRRPRRLLLDCFSARCARLLVAVAAAVFRPKPSRRRGGDLVEGTAPTSSRSPRQSRRPGPPSWKRRASTPLPPELTPCPNNRGRSPHPWR